MLNSPSNFQSSSLFSVIVAKLGCDWIYAKRATLDSRVILIATSVPNRFLPHLADRKCELCDLCHFCDAVKAAENFEIAKLTAQNLELEAQSVGLSLWGVAGF
jgi:hypothetical protein